MTGKRTAIFYRGNTIDIVWWPPSSDKYSEMSLKYKNWKKAGAFYSEVHLFNKTQVRQYYLALALKLITQEGLTFKSIHQAFNIIDEYREAWDLLDRAHIYEYQEVSDEEQPLAFEPKANLSSLPEGYPGIMGKRGPKRPTRLNTMKYIGNGHD